MTMNIVKCIFFCCLFVIILGVCNINCKTNHRKQTRQRRLTILHRRNRANEVKEAKKEFSLSNRYSSVTQKIIPESRKSLWLDARKQHKKSQKQKKYSNKRKRKNYKNRSKARKFGKTNQRNHNIRTETIKDVDLSLPGLYNIMQPTYFWHSRMEELSRPTETGHLKGFLRLKRLYCRIDIGYHLEIYENGTIQANHAQTPEGILEIFSVKRSVVGIRSARSSLYLCMNKSGRVFARKTFQPDCEFRENIEKNMYNTYASEQYSDHEKRSGYFLAVTRHGTIPKKMRKISYMQKRAHWLPRVV